MERLQALTRFVTGRRTKWIVLVIWLILAVGAGPLAGKLAGIQENDTAQWLPGAAEATQVFDLQERFRTTDSSPAVVLYTRDAGITDADRARADSDVSRISGVEGLAGSVTGPLPSADGKALQVVVPFEMGADGTEKLSDRVAAVREVTGTGENGLAVYVTGPAGTLADQIDAFAGTDATLLFATVIVVMIILLLTYRSPILWLLPVLTAGVALFSAQAVIYLIAEAFDLTITGQSFGILTVLVFGAGTNYALLLVARYREELRRHEDRHEAMALAVRRAGPAIVASALTVAAAMLCLTAAQMNSTRGLGPVCAIGILVGLATMYTLLPALLVICGRWVFWPVRPQLGTSEPSAKGGWAKIGHRIAKRPRSVWIVTALVLAAGALGMTRLDAHGLSVEGSFVDTPRSVTGQQILGTHFPAGQGQPVVVIGNVSATDQLRQALAGTEGIAEVGRPAVAGDLVMLEGTMTAQPDSDEARRTVALARDNVHAVSGADAKVGGVTALAADMDDASSHDNAVIIPLVLAVVLIALGLLLRAVVAPLVLVATVVLSYGTAMGLSALAFEHLLGFDGQDAALPLLIFVFLVALGIDYNIFLMTRVREETQRSDPRTGTITGLAATGGVITSAGLVLAATFAVLAALPLVNFAQMGFAVALGVLIDTFIVRSVLVTALSLDLGRRMWVPSALAKQSDESSSGQGDQPSKLSLVP